MLESPALWRRRYIRLPISPLQLSLCSCWHAAIRLRFLAPLVGRHPGSLLLLLSTGAVVLFVILDNRRGLAGLIDTFLMPVLLFLVAAKLGSFTKRRLEMLLHVLIAGNALLTLFEFLGGVQLFPYRFEGELLIDTRRMACRATLSSMLSSSEPMLSFSSLALARGSAQG